tara:strand:- start:562 stop:1407 length:846 start_codon:yes stop_codon:yes gene_type:complete
MMAKKKKRSSKPKVKSTPHLMTLNLRRVGELVRMKNSGGIVISEEMRTIQDDTDRVVEDQVAEKYEFRYKDTNNFVKKGARYHIHYTKYLGEYYMTPMSHDSILSRLIIRQSNFTEFDKYNKLNSQSPMHLTAFAPKPTTKDYKNGYMERHFARKSNQTSSPFEIHPSDNGASPLYTYVTIRWKIAGRKNVVKFFNKAQVLTASKTFPNIQRLLPDFQYLVATEDLSAEETVKKLLGIPDYSEMEGISVAGGTIGAGLMAHFKRSGGKKKKKKSSKTKSKY